MWSRIISASDSITRSRSFLRDPTSRAMPVARSTKSATTQLTLTGKPAPYKSESESKSKSKSKSKSSPNRVYTDAVLVIRSEFVELIASREKNHEYRTYKLRDTLARIWLYESGPVSAITCVIPCDSREYTHRTMPSYVMETGNPKTPGQVKDPSGVGNDDFDSGIKKSKYGYPVLGLYKLKTPLNANEMRKHGITPPQGYMYATKNLVEAYPLSEMEKIF